MKKRSDKNFKFPHQTECAIRGLAHGSRACQKLAEFLTGQQTPAFDSMTKNFADAADKFRKAMNWAEQATQKP
jgi:hypothetical protein